MIDLEKKYDRIARIYDLIDWPFERFRYKKIRRRIWDGLSGNILDAGVGTGCNIPFYPKSARVVGVDLSSNMIKRAKKKADMLGKSVELKKESLYQLPFSNEYFDFVVATFICCLIKQPNLALSELRRVCKKDGSLYFLEYVLSQNPFHRFIQRIITPYAHFVFGVNFKKDTLSILKKGGFKIISEENLVKDILKLIVAKP